jgi:hypothetical protein
MVLRGEGQRLDQSLKEFGVFRQEHSLYSNNVPLVIPERYDWAEKQTAIEKANQKCFAFPLLLLYRMDGQSPMLHSTSCHDLNHIRYSTSESHRL